MIFNGVDLSDYINIKSIKGRWITPYEISLLSVAGMDGAHYEDKKIASRLLEIECDIKAENKKALIEKIEYLNEILSVDEPVPIQFDFEADRTYFGIPSDSSEGNESFFIHDGRLNILCPDPYKYGPELEATFPSDAVTITNNGTAPAKPIYEMEVNEPTTFAAISNGEETMMIGRPVDVSDAAPYKKYERVFYSNASSLVGWTNGTYVDGGVVAGQMESNGTRFQASSYGSGNAWHGPAIKQSLPEVLTDFRMESFISFYNGNLPMYVGRVEIYLLDANEQVVGKVAIRDSLSGQALTVGEVRAGSGSNSHFLINESGDRPGNWNNFSGQVRIEREGNVWRAYIAMVDTTTGRHHTRRAATWVDSENRFTRTVAQVQIHIGQYRTHQTPASGVYSLSVYKINQEEQGIPYIADAGDVIVFDHEDNNILINGEPRKDLKQFGSEYFRLKPGDNHLVTMPEETLTTKVRYREPYR